MNDAAPREPITWTEKKVETSALKFTPNNPRQISVKNFKRLTDKIKRFGYHDRIKVQPDLTMIGGNMRLRALVGLNIKEVTVLIPSRQLDESEVKELIVTDNLHDGDWDIDLLGSNYDADDLVGMGFPEGLIEYPDADEKKDGDKKVDAEDDDELMMLDFCPHCGKSLPPR